VLFRGRCCSSITFRDLSLEEGLTTPEAVEDFSSELGPFLVSRVANCSNRDFSELTEERVDSSALSVSIVETQPASKDKKLPSDSTLMKCIH